MPKKRKYTITMKVKDENGNPVTDDAGNVIEDQRIRIVFNRHGNIKKMVKVDLNTGNETDLEEDVGFVEMPGDFVIEAIADRNPRWVKINGRWYYI